jgi:hypothetical protein
LSKLGGFITISRFFWGKDGKVVPDNGQNRLWSQEPIVVDIPRSNAVESMHDGFVSDWPNHCTIVTIQVETALTCKD